MSIKSWFDKLLGNPIEFSLVRTKGGDDGRSGLYSGERLFKSEPYFNVLGDIDELNAYIGVIRSTHHSIGIVIKAQLRDIQTNLIHISSIIATNPSSENYPCYPLENYLRELEESMQGLMKNLSIPNYFVHYGQRGEVSAMFDFARAICRRAERTLVGFIQGLNEDWYDAKICQKYINCLSDYLWVCARKVEE